MRNVLFSIGKMGNYQAKLLNFYLPCPTVKYLTSRTFFHVLLQLRAESSNTMNYTSVLGHPGSIELF